MSGGVKLSLGISGLTSFVTLLKIIRGGLLLPPFSSFESFLSDLLLLDTLLATSLFLCAAVSLIVASPPLFLEPCGAERSVVAGDLML